MNRGEHLFQFAADEIAKAARCEAQYHRMREGYWKSSYDIAVAMVEATIGARVERQPMTGGYYVDVVIDYGDPAAYARMQLAYKKIHHHREAAEAFESDEAVYGSQGVRAYELARADVQYFRLGAEPRPDDNGD